MAHLDGQLAIIAWPVRQLQRQPKPPPDGRPAPLLSRLVQRARRPRIGLHPSDAVWPALRDYPYRPTSD